MKTVTLYDAKTFNEIATANDVYDFSLRHSNKSAEIFADSEGGEWVLDIWYYDEEDSERDRTDSMTLCKASCRDPWTDLIMITKDDEHMDIRASDNMIKMLSIVAECALKVKQFIWKSSH